MSLGRKIDRVTRRLNRAVTELSDRREPLHFLHLSKNAGTQIKSLAEQYNAHKGVYRLVLHPHSVTLKSIPQGQRYFFSIRHPVSRFKSGFYSRLRQGKPQYFSKWSPQEEIAFRHFEHANHLAETLFSDGADGIAAYQAMRSIRHLARNQVEWFDHNGHFLELNPPFAILRQEAFDADLANFLTKVGAPSMSSGPQTPDPALGAHHNSYDDVPPLSQKAKGNLERWYAPDMAFYAMCCAWLDQ